MSHDSDILFVLPELSQTVGGVHTVVDLCRDLNARGLRAQCLVLGMFNEQVQASYQEPLPSGMLLHAPHWLRFVFETPARPKLVVSTFFATSLPALLFARLRGIPHIHYVQGYEFFFDGGRNYNQVADAYHFADQIVVTSHWLMDGVKRHAPERPVTLLPLGIDLERCQWADRPRNPKMRIGVVLRSGAEKGQAVLLDTLQRLYARKDVVALTVLLSPGYEVPGVWANENDLRVVQLPVDRATLAQHLQTCDIFLDASLHEGFGLLPLEAMACGAVPIVSDSGGVREYCGAENSVIVTEANQPKRYVAAIEMLLGDLDMYERLRERGRTVAQQFNAKSANFRYFEYFKRQIGATAPGPDLLNALRQQPMHAAATRNMLAEFFAVLDKQARIEDILRHERHKLATGYGAYRHVKGWLPRRLRRALYYLFVNPPEA